MTRCPAKTSLTAMSIQAPLSHLRQPERDNVRVGSPLPLEVRKPRAGSISPFSVATRPRFDLSHLITSLMQRSLGPQLWILCAIALATSGTRGYRSSNRVNSMATVPRASMNRRKVIGSLSTDSCAVPTLPRFLDTLPGRLPLHVGTTRWPGPSRCVQFRRDFKMLPCGAQK